METVRTISDMKLLRQRLAEPVGFVPTMGFLHEGHLSLIRRARSENRHVIVSIFVNPTQFGPEEDFDSYPRDTERDLTLLKQEKADVVFMPEPEKIYPPGACTWVEVEGLTEMLEGISRPGHFRGVATVVTKLFNIIEPTYAYFGQKDAQQARVIRKMAEDLFMNLEIIVCPTIREPDGLAMSSRNFYLKGKERKAALILYKSLQLAQSLWNRGERHAGKIRGEIVSLIESEPLARIGYVSVADTETLQEIEEEIEYEALLSMAVKVGKPRLLDSIVLSGSA
ncbi:MAG TPA: pantoate--beta-alanine ligase [Deltaproteobacteria bacterium]|nr:pantoate--beta-alanine ligase [Deltaproteobacteria bacterium]